MLMYEGHPVPSENVTDHGHFLAPVKSGKRQRHVCRIPDAAARPAGSRWLCHDCRRVWRLYQRHDNPVIIDVRRRAVRMTGRGDWWDLVQGRRPGGWFG